MKLKLILLQDAANEIYKNKKYQKKVKIKIK